MILSQFIKSDLNESANECIVSHEYPLLIGDQYNKPQITGILK